LYKYPLIMLNESFSSYRLVKEYIIEQGIAADKLKIMCHLDSTESVKSAVMSQHGLAFLPYMAMKKELYQKQLKIINLEDFDLNYDVYSIHRTKAEIGNDKLYEVIKYFITTVNKSIC
ncbi:MAG: LysR substrate-binding domain-containing protein, partial [Oscillospiraceae bacterium]